jgi:hypothetical protein
LLLLQIVVEVPLLWALAAAALVLLLTLHQWQHFKRTTA